MGIFSDRSGEAEEGKGVRVRSGRLMVGLYLGTVVSSVENVCLQGKEHWATVKSRIGNPPWLPDDPKFQE
jgi:hypothetical protein